MPLQQRYVIKIFWNTSSDFLLSLCVNYGVGSSQRVQIEIRIDKELARALGSSSTRHKIEYIYFYCTETQSEGTKK